MGEYFSLAAEILVDLAHALHLFYAERAAALEMTAVQARVGLHGQPGIVVRGNRAAREGKVVILVHKAMSMPAGQGWQWLKYTHVPVTASVLNEPMTE